MLFTKLVLIFIKVPAVFIIAARLRLSLRELSTISIKAFLWELAGLFAPSNHQFKQWVGEKRQYEVNEDE